MRAQHTACLTGARGASTYRKASALTAVQQHGQIELAHKAIGFCWQMVGYQESGTGGMCAPLRPAEAVGHAPQPAVERSSSRSAPAKMHNPARSNSVPMWVAGEATQTPTLVPAVCANRSARPSAMACSSVTAAAIDPCSVARRQAVPCRAATVRLSRVATQPVSNTCSTSARTALAGPSTTRCCRRTFPHGRKAHQTHREAQLDRQAQRITLPNLALWDQGPRCARPAARVLAPLRAAPPPSLGSWQVRRIGGLISRPRQAGPWLGTSKRLAPRISRAQACIRRHSRSLDTRQQTWSTFADGARPSGLWMRDTAGSSP